MPKPVRQILLDDQLARFTDREDIQQIFVQYLSSTREAPVIMLFGLGGAGKSWILRKLAEIAPRELPIAKLDFDPERRGQRYVHDPSAALYDIREQFGLPAPRFDLAYAVMRYKQGASSETGIWVDLAAALAGSWIPMPGASSVLKMMSKPLLQKLKGTPIERFLYTVDGNRFAVEIRTQTSQEIDNQLLQFLADDLRSSLPRHLNHAASAIVLIDTYEALAAGVQNTEHLRQRTQWLRDLVSQFDFALVVVAGQNRLTWPDDDPSWNDTGLLEQHLVGGLAASDARRLLSTCGINSSDLQDCILATSLDSGKGYHCFSLGLCIDICESDRAAGRTTSPPSLTFRPNDWESLAARFLKSLSTNVQRRWIERLALTPRFDEQAGKSAYSDAVNIGQEAEWKALLGYSFVQQLNPDEQLWFAIRSEMSDALRAQPSAVDRVQKDHVWWRNFWQTRAHSATDEAASLAWYHHWNIDPLVAAIEWGRLAETTRRASPPRMQDHFNLLQWWDPTKLPSRRGTSIGFVVSLTIAGSEAIESTIGGRAQNIARGIGYFDRALSLVSEQEHPEQKARILSNLGRAWSEVESENLRETLTLSLKYLNEALLVFSENSHPYEWAATQNGLGGVWAKWPLGDASRNLSLATEHYEAASRVYTRESFPEQWATIQFNLGWLWQRTSVEDGSNLTRAQTYYEAALLNFSQDQFAWQWGATHTNLGMICARLSVNDVRQFERAEFHFEAAQQICTEQQFPEHWAFIQKCLGNLWAGFALGNRVENLTHATGYFKNALRVYTTRLFPEVHEELVQLISSIQSFVAGELGEG